MKFDVYEDVGGHYRWRLFSGSEKVAASRQSFYDESNAPRAANEFKASAGRDTYNLWQTGDRWYWDASSTNGKKVATGGQAFVSSHDAERAAENVRDNAGSASGP